MALTKGEQVIKFIEKYLVVPEADLVGQPVRLEQFQKDFILAVFDNPNITDTAILSIARKNAKTALIAFIVISYLVGPLAIQNARIISGALSREQAAEVFNLAAKCLNLAPKLEGTFVITPSSKTIVGLAKNVEYKAIAAEGKTAHGKSPMVAILDEMGQIKGPQSDFVDAITTAQGAYSNPLLIYISTQAASDSDLFSVLIDDYRIDPHPKTVCHVYEAKKDCEIMDKTQWYASNPALGKFRSMDDMIKQAEKAARMPSFANTFRNLNLNQRVSVFAPFIPIDGWKKAIVEHGIPPGLDVYGGLDLSMRTDLTSFSLVGESDGIVYVETYFWTPEHGVLDREKRDRQPYSQWVDEGYLITTPGKTVDYEFVVGDIIRILDDRNLVKLGFDRYKIEHFKKCCGEIDLNLVEFGQGFKSMSPAIEKVEELILNERLKHLHNPAQTMCAANASTVKDPTDARKLCKRKSTGRIDGIAAMTMAIGVMYGSEFDEEEDAEDYYNNPIIIKR